MSSVLSPSHLDAAISHPQEPESALALGIDQGRICACLVEKVAGQHRLIGWEIDDRRLDAPVDRAAAELIQRLGSRLRRRLWDEEAGAPFTHSPDPVRHPPVNQVSVTASPMPLLRVWLVGLTDGISLQAARHALAACPVQIVGTTCAALDGSREQLARGLADLRPQAILVVGGYDVDQTPVQYIMSSTVADVLETRSQMPESRRPHLLYAGNHPVGERLAAAEHGTCEVTPNIMPAPGVVRQEELVQRLYGRYWAECRRIAGFAQVEGWSTDPMSSTTVEMSFAKLVSVWREANHLPQLHGLYDATLWRFHVWSHADDPVMRARYAAADQAAPSGWPVVELRSGAPAPQISAEHADTWRDPTGMAPVIAAIGHAAPMAMLQVLTTDLFETWDA